MPGSTTTKTPAAHPPAPAPTATMFGVTISTAKASVEVPPMSKKKKRLIIAAALAPVLGFLLWYQYRPVSDLDPEAASNPAVKQVVELEKKGDTSALAQLTRSDDSAVARRAISALGTAGRFDAVLDSLKDRRPEVRYVAVSSLGNSTDVSQLQTLAQYTQDPAPQVRIAAIRGISNIRDFSMFDHLIPMLSDPQPSVRRSALQAIQDRVGLQFPDFDPEASVAERQKGLNRIRAMVPKMKQVFDRANDFELRHQK